MKLWRLPKIEGSSTIKFLPFGSPIWVKGGQQFAKAYGIKVRCYGEYVGEYIGNLGNILGTQ